MNQQISDWELNEYRRLKRGYKFAQLAIVAGVLLVVAAMGGCPKYNVWRAGLQGEAELRRAAQNRQIAVEEALAKKESAGHVRDAEVIRAEGIDKANKIIAGGLGGAEGYLRYLYIDALQNTACETIYVPTEAGLPILEAARAAKP